jgi:polyhydroxybutyrate depolymerase
MADAAAPSLRRRLLAAARSWWRGWAVLSTGAALLASMSCAAGRGGAYPAGDDLLTKGELPWGGRTRTFRYHMPKGATGATLPMVLAIHGRLGDGVRMEKLAGFVPLADREGFVVVYPEGVDRSWNDDRGGTPAAKENIDDVGYVSALIDLFVKQHRVDPARVYAVGISNGGFFVQRLACQLSDKLAAVAVVVATVPKALPERCKPARPVPIAFYLGTADGFVPYAGGTVRGDAGGDTLSADASARFWARTNGCGTDAQRSAVAGPSGGAESRSADGGMPVARAVFHGCRADVVLYTIEGGGHTWPGGWQYAAEFIVGKTARDFSATQSCWNFFRGHRLATS